MSEDVTHPEDIEYLSVSKFMNSWSAILQEPQVSASNLVWLRPVVPSKRNGRKGTRKDWKRNNPPGWYSLSFIGPFADMGILPGTVEDKLTSITIKYIGETERAKDV